MYRQTFEIEGTAAWGEADRDPDLRMRAAPFSLAYFCPKCARIWARCKIEGEPWMVTTVACSNCGKFSLISIPGSLWRALDNDFNYALPREVLLREFELHLQWYDRYRQKEEVCVQTTTNQPIEKTVLTPGILAPDSSNKPNPLQGLRRL